MQNDLWALEAPRTFSWRNEGAEGQFVDVYDWDTIFVSLGPHNRLAHHINLCTGFYPCALSVVGNEGSAIERMDSGSISCSNANGCTKILLQSVMFICTSVANTSLMEIEASDLDVMGTQFIGCSSWTDGGVARCFGEGARISIASSGFHGTHSRGVGGSVSAVGCTVSVYQSNFSNCSSTMGGGAISATEYVCYGSFRTLRSTVSIESSLFDGCQSQGSGGAIHLTSVYSSMDVVGSQFKNCISETSGGAIFVSDKAVANVSASAFYGNEAADMGGCIFVSKFARVHASSSTLADNEALGSGGGALGALDAFLYMDSLSCSGNKAVSGGGGILFWGGTSAPWYENQRMSDTVPNGSFCGARNVASYGNCIATPYSMLLLHNLPSKVHPGLPFAVTVSKQDAYNQTITSDSSTVLQILSKQVGDPSGDENASVLSGMYLAALKNGVGSFYVSVTPSYANIDASKNFAPPLRQPLIFVKGFDEQTDLAISSPSISLEIPVDASVCPPGYTLSLTPWTSSNTLATATNSTNTQKIRQGTCLLCPRGTYSLSPLFAVTSQDPSCLQCPAGGICNGGLEVQFPVGHWNIRGGIYVLTSCPSGHQLVDSRSGVFAQDAQICAACADDGYILDSGDSAYSCQACPVGAACNGSTLKGLVDGSVWIANAGTGKYQLASCPKGYELQAITYDSQQCALCPVSSYCIGGSSPAIPCPPATFAPTGSSALSSCLPAVFVNVVIGMQVTAADFTKIKSSFVSALSAASRVSVGNIAVVSFSHTMSRGMKPLGLNASAKNFQQRQIQQNLISEFERRIQQSQSNSESMEISSNLATSDSEAASNVYKILDQKCIDSALSLFNLPPGKLESVSIKGQASSNDVTRWILASCLIGGLSAMLLIGFCIFKILGRKIVHEEEMALMLKISEMRAWFHLTQSDGYMLASESPSWISGRTHVLLRLSLLEAAARMALTQEFDVHQFNAFCSFVETESQPVSSSVKGRLLRSFLSFTDWTGELPLEVNRYVILCTFMLDIAKELMRPDIPALNDKEAATKHQSFSDSCKLPAAHRYRYFFNVLMKARIWQDDEVLFSKLKMSATKYMDQVSGHCHLRYECLRDEPRGHELLRFQMNLNTEISTDSNRA